jgi:RsiW-degrading membrane proteinase PrsW (M82 family)
MRRWAWLVVLVVGAALYVIVLRTLVDTQNPNFVPSLILLGSAVVPASVLAYAGWSRGGAQVGSDLVMLVVVLGGVIGTVSAGILEYDAMKDLGFLPMVGVGLIEETAKLLLPATLLLFVRTRDPGTAVLLGVASGAGFAVLETMGYAFTALLSSQGNLDAVDDTLLIRGLLAPAGHVAWTGLATVALWIFAGTPTARNALRFLGVFVAVVALHGAWDGFDGLWPKVVVGVIGFGALLWTVRRYRVTRAPGVPAYKIS